MNKECFIIVTHGSYREYKELPCYPDEVSENLSANWSDESLIGRSSPISMYTGTNYRNITVSFDLHREMLDKSEPRTDNSVEIDRILKLIRKSVYPAYTHAGATLDITPPITTLVLGKFRAKGIVRNFSFTWKKPIIDGKYQLCSVSITMDDVPEYVYDVGVSSSQYPENPFSVIIEDFI